MREGGGREEKIGSRERGERVALSELRIIITVVVGAARRRRGGARGIHGDGPGGEKDERPLPRGWKRVYLPTANTHRYASVPRTDLDGNLRHSEALAKKIA